MELKIYLRVLLRKWWVVLPAFLATLTATAVLTYSQLPVYSSTITYVVAPNSSFEDVKSFTSGLDILSRRTEIAATYAEVVTSRRIRQEAADELNLSDEQRESLSIFSLVRAGTNVLEITVEGQDPLLVRVMANVVGAKTEMYVGDLYESYDLRLLDEATRATSPVGPNKTLNLVLGAVLGLVLGGGLAFFSEYLQTPLEGVTSLGVLDEESGAYNRRYFTQRLGEEMSRAKRNHYPLSLALMNVDHLEVMSKTFVLSARREALRKVAMLLRQYLREEDILARVGHTTFALLLPDMPGEEAKAVLERLQARVSGALIELERSGVTLSLSSAAGVVDYQYNGTRQEELLNQANRALEEAEAGGFGKVYLPSKDREKLIPID
jgi:diguanylate cyclase (GGDEF)-like protein